MKTALKKQLQLFLVSEDERKLTELLRSKINNISFLNGSVWPEKPDFRNSIEECDRDLVYLYNGDRDKLPTLRRKTGEIEGPASGCVIQLIRCRSAESALFSGTDLFSGRIAVGVLEGDTEMFKFVSTVWKCVKKIGTIGVLRYDGWVDRKYLVGYETRRAVESGELHLCDGALKTNMRYKLAN